MKKVIVIIIMVLVASVMWAQESVTMDGIYKPQFMLGSGDNLYITEGAQIHLYSLSEKKVVKSFGKAGEGPQEFKVFPGGSLSLGIKGDQLVVYSMSKVSFFTKDGNFIREIKTTNIMNQYFVVDDSYVGFGYSQKDQSAVLTINLYDKEFKKTKELIQMPIFVGGKLKLLSRSFFCQTHGSNVLVAGSGKLNIDVMDIKGNKKFAINKPYENIKLTKAMQEEALEFYRQNPATRAAFETLKKMAEFPDTFPAIRSLMVSGDTLYVQTFNRKDKKTEFFLFNLEKGKATFKKSVWLPIMRDNPLEAIQWFAFHKGKLYQLVEDSEEDEEELTLQVISVD